MVANDSSLQQQQVPASILMQQLDGSNNIAISKGNNDNSNMKQQSDDTMMQTSAADHNNSMHLPSPSSPSMQQPSRQYQHATEEIDNTTSFYSTDDHDEHHQPAQQQQQQQQHHHHHHHHHHNQQQQQDEDINNKNVTISMEPECKGRINEYGASTCPGRWRQVDYHYCDLIQCTTTTNSQPTSLCETNIDGSPPKVNMVPPFTDKIVTSINLRQGDHHNLPPSEAEPMALMESTHPASPPPHKVNVATMVDSATGTHDDDIMLNESTITSAALQKQIPTTTTNKSFTTATTTTEATVNKTNQHYSKIKSGNHQNRWSENYKNMKLDGIIFIDHHGTIVNFVVIKSPFKEANDPVYRTKVHLDKNGKPILAPPQTFDQMIQAKRRQQMLLYPLGPSSRTVSPTDLLSTSQQDQGSFMMQDTARTVTTSRIYTGRRRPTRRKKARPASSG